jgi:hypothetical protein
VTSTSELFVEEGVKELLLEKHPQLDRISIETPDEWLGLWGAAEFPDTGEAKVLRDDEFIGTVRWKVRFYIEIGSLAGRYIEAEPEDVEFTSKEEVQEVVEGIKRYCEECHGKGYFEDVYLSEYEGSIPDKWLSEDVMSDIQEKFYCFHRPIVDFAAAKLGQKSLVRIAVDPSYEDTTLVVVFHPGSGRVLYTTDIKAWNFWFTNEEELESHTMSVYRTIRRTLSD